MTREINKRLAKIEDHLSLQDPYGEKATMLRTVRQKDPRLAMRLQIALCDAGGDVELGLRKLSNEDVDALVALFSSMVSEASEPDVAVDADVREPAQTAETAT